MPRDHGDAGMGRLERAQVGQVLLAQLRSEMAGERESVLGGAGKHDLGPGVRAQGGWS